MIRLKNCRGLTPFCFFTLPNLWLAVSVGQVLRALIFTKKNHTKLLSKLYIYLRSSQPPHLSTLVCTEPRFLSIESIAIISQHRQHQRWCPFFKTCTFYHRGREILANSGYFCGNICTFWCTFYKPKECGGVPKLTNMRYDKILQRFSRTPVGGCTDSLNFSSISRLSMARKGIFPLVQVQRNVLRSLIKLYRRISRFRVST